jgi:hypothetical protein
MANSLYGKFGGNQNGGNSQFGSQFSMFVNGLSNDIKSNPMAAVQNLLNSRQMSQSQFEQYRQIANRLTGKNY